MKKNIFIIGIILLLMVSIGVVLYQKVSNLDASASEKYYVTADDGMKFKVIYRLYNFPDESYSIDLYGKSNDHTSIFGGDGYGNKNITIKKLYQQNPYKYYLAKNENGLEKFFVCSDEEKLKLISDGSYIDSYSDELLFTYDQNEYSLRIFCPLAKERILKHNEGDYTIGYAEELIKQGNQDVMDKILFFTKNPDKIKFSYYSREEILTKCQELLKIYGGVE